MAILKRNYLKNISGQYAVAELRCIACDNVLTDSELEEYYIAGDTEEDLCRGCLGIAQQALREFDDDEQ